jgi:ribosome-binding factor A
MIQTLSSEQILEFQKEFDHQFGIISVTQVDISSDEWYADIIVSSSEDNPWLPKFLAPIAARIEKSIGKEFGIRKSPRIRFRIKKKSGTPEDILSLIDKLDKQYGLSE